MNRTLVIAITGAVALLMACGDDPAPDSGPENGSLNPDGSVGFDGFDTPMDDDRDDDRDDPDDDRDDPDDDPDDDRDDDLDDDVVVEIEWCLPQAVPYDTSQIPPVAAGVDPSTFCEVSPLATDGIATNLFTFDEATGILEVESVAMNGPGNSLVRYAFDEAGQIVEAYRRGASGWYSIGGGETWYYLNEFGQLDRKVAIGLLFSEVFDSTTETIQTWDAQRLLSREVLNGLDGPVIRAHQWSYDDDGRLLLATLTENDLVTETTRTYEAAWSYHASGLPAAVERFVDDTLVERETWSFDTEGTLISRSYESVSREQLALDEGREAFDWEFPVGLDSYQRVVDNPYIDDPWQSALPASTGTDSCFLLPRGPGHGYPDGEPEYQLGVSRDGRPNGIGFAYGDTSFGWNYGDLAWYGHDGAGSAWMGTPANGNMPAIDAVVGYHNGTMVSEHMTVTPFGSSSFSLERNRNIRNGVITSDRLVPAEEMGDLGEGLDRVLRFGRDSDGFLVERELLVDGQLVDRQTWERDARGRVLKHNVVTAIGTLSNAFNDVIGYGVFSGFGAGPVADAEWFWRYEGDLLVERGGGPTELHQVRTYDDQGRVVEVVGRFESFDNNGSETWMYDELDRVLEYCTSFDEGTSWTCTVTVYDDAGRVAWRLSERTDAEPYVFETNDYSCLE